MLPVNTGIIFFYVTESSFHSYFIIKLLHGYFNLQDVGVPLLHGHVDRVEGAVLHHLLDDGEEISPI